MRVDIQQQWLKITKWYWEEFDRYEPKHPDHYLSIWDVLERDYGARKGVNIKALQGDTSNREMWVVFPDEKSYTAFLLRWS